MRPYMRGHATGARKISLKRPLKAIAASLGYDLVRRRPYSNDLDAFAQQHRILANLPSPIIFDVGAHNGETSKIYAELFPNAKIYAFEPYSESFEALARNTADLPQVTVHPLGLADAQQELLLNVNLSAATNSLLETDERAADAWGRGVCETYNRVPCRFTSLDAFLTDGGIPHVNLLKLDVQGAEFRVFLGAQGALNGGLIDVIYMEIIVMPTYRKQQRLSYYLNMLESNKMNLYGIYNLSYTSGQLRQIDAIFIRDGYNWGAMPNN
jgi:FkbM family methyltransferase